MIQFERNVPRRVRQIVLVALDLCDERYFVRGGMSALQSAMGHDSDASTRSCVREAESWGLMKRIGHAGGQSGQRIVSVVASRLLYNGSCATPGCIRKTSGTWCSACSNAQRSDRSWKHRAVDMAIAGTSPSSIAAILNRPLTEIVKTILSEVPGAIDQAWQDCLERPIDRTQKERKRKMRAARRDEAAT